MEVLTDCEGRLRDTASKKILVEVTLLKMIEARHAVSIDTVLKQVQQLRAEAGRRRAARPRPAASRPPPRPGSRARGSRSRVAEPLRRRHRAAPHSGGLGAALGESGRSGRPRQPVCADVFYRGASGVAGEKRIDHRF